MIPIPHNDKQATLNREQSRHIHENITVLFSRIFRIFICQLLFSFSNARNTLSRFLGLNATPFVFCRVFMAGGHPSQEQAAEADNVSACQSHADLARAQDSRGGLG